jgi:hypothetical protein
MALHHEVRDFMQDTVAEQGKLLPCHDADVQSSQSGIVAHERVPPENTLIAIYKFHWLISFSYYIFVGYHP